MRNVLSGTYLANKLLVINPDSSFDAVVLDGVASSKRLRASMVNVNENASGQKLLQLCAQV